MKRLQKQTFLVCILALFAQMYGNNGAFTTTSDLFATEHQEALMPASIEALQQLVIQAHAHHKNIAVVGAGKSMGGQTVPPTPSDYRLSLCKLNKLIDLNVREKTVVVEAGMTWKELQQHIAPHGLSIKSMQSYHDFSIGGSLSVNIHGQALKYAPIIGTVISCTLLQADGSLITLSREENYELFKLVIGGYGLFGIIVDVTLSLTDDMLLVQKSTIIDANNLSEYFLCNIKDNPSIEFYSARFLLTKSDLLQKAYIITYEQTDQVKGHNFQLTQNPKNIVQKTLLTLTSKSSLIKHIRFMIEGLYLKKPELITRNNFTNHTIESLPSTTNNSQYILQEYFIPYPELNRFLDNLRTTITLNSINMINVTARHVHADNESRLSFAKQDCCALVLYINIGRNENAYTSTIAWTRKLIDAACDCGGTYYLPYQLLATPEQLDRAYPAFNSVMTAKKLYDPQHMFVNQLYMRYAN